MKKLIIFISIITIVIGCRTQKEITTNTIVKDSIVYKTNTVVKDSIVTLLLPHDTVFISKFIEQNSFNVIKDIDTIIVESGIVGAKAWLYKSNLGVMAYVSDSTLYFKLDSARISITKYKELYEIERTSKQKKIVVYKNNIFGRIGVWWLIISVVLLFLYAVLKIKGVL